MSNTTNKINIFKTSYDANTHGKILALDGHDGSGKTTLTQALVKAKNAQYVRPYAEPFGSALMEAYQKSDFEKILSIAQTAINHALKDIDMSQPMIFDRCWVTVFTVLSSDMRAAWLWRPLTVVIWADLDTTLERLNKRDEPAETKEWHAHYIHAYQQLAQQHQLHLINTSQINEPTALDILINLFDSN